MSAPFADRGTPSPGLARQVLLFVLAAALSGFTVLRGISPHDEGLMLQAGARIASGQWPYRDFWTNYPPGQPLVLALLQLVFGHSLLAWRIVRTLTDATVALLAYRLARRRAPESYALGAWLAVAGAMAFPTGPGPNPPALALAFAALLAARRRPALAGVLAGLACLFRFEIGVAAILGVLLEAPPGTRIRSLVVGVLVALVTLAPFFAVAPGAMYHDTIGFYSIQGLQRLPFPLDFDGPLRPSKLIEFYIPLILVVGLALWALAVALALARRLSSSPSATAALHGGITARRRARGIDPGSLSLIPLLIVSLGYLLGRTDVFHLVPLSPVLAVALAWAAAAAEIAVLRVALLAALALIALHGLDRRAGQFLHPPALAAVPGPAGDGVQTGTADARALRELERTVGSLTRPGEPIFVANPRFDLVQAGDPLLYIILGHPNPTRYDVMQPGLVTTAPVQRQIIASLQSSGTPCGRPLAEPAGDARRARRRQPLERRPPPRPLPGPHVRALRTLRRLPGAGAQVSDRLSFPRSELRRRTVRGAAVTSVFLVGIDGLVLIQGLVVTRLLGPVAIGLYGVVSTTVISLIALKRIGVDEAFVAQDEPDQPREFQYAFTLDLGLSVGMTAVILLAAPLVALVYREHQLLALMASLAYLPIAFALQAPLWIFFRRMDYRRQRSLQAIQPFVCFCVTIPLAAATNLGVWSLIVGQIAGYLVAVPITIASSPFPLAIRYDRAVARRYMLFSAPVFVTVIAAMFIAQGQILAIKLHDGLAAAGYITLAVTLTRYIDRADQIITATIYPAICAIKDQRRALEELYEKSNRATLIWVLPYAVGIVLFAPDLVHFLLGPKWAPAVVLLQGLAVAGAITQLGFNWFSFYRARGETRPAAVEAVIGATAFVVLAIGGLLLDGFHGFVAGRVLAALVALCVRTVYTRRLLPGVRFRALLAPTLPPLAAATALTVALRLALWGGKRTLLQAIAELVLFAVVYTASAAHQERSLLSELLGARRRIDERMAAD